jgi:hypothetical protein
MCRCGVLEARLSRRGIASLKAGRTSSILGSDTTSSAFVSVALNTLLKEIGSASFFLNTIVVGLDAVETGHEKPAGLDISWDPRDRVVAARMARKFAVESCMVRCAESLKVYIQSISKLPRFSELQGKWAAQEKANKKPGAAAKLEDIAKSLLEDSDPLIAAGMLLLIWRNNIVHDGDLSFPHHRKQTLLKNKLEISANYRNLDVDLLLDHARAQKPTLKDVSCLIAMTINLARAIDRKVHDNLGEEDLIATLSILGLDKSIARIKRETTPESVAASIKRCIESEAPGLYPTFENLLGPDGSRLN